jgi:hypothetical protein
MRRVEDVRVSVCKESSGEELRKKRLLVATQKMCVRGSG